ncbi:unnamed protein product, partial [Symbiodinium pilosum]
MLEQDRLGLWEYSAPAQSFDIFLSHTWLTPGRWKVVSLLFQSGYHFTLVSVVTCVAATCLLCGWRVLPMPFTYIVDYPDFEAHYPYAPWPSMMGLLSTVSWIPF